MTKKLLIVFFLILGLTSGYAQTVIWQDEFDNGEGWNMQDNWAINYGTLQFTWMPEATNFDLTATSLPFYLEENSTELVINQFLSIFYPSTDETAQIRLITQDDQIIIWDYPLSNGDWGLSSGSDLVIPIHDFAGTQVQLQFRTFGVTTFNWNQWDVNDVRVYGTFDKDIATTNISGPKSVELFETGIWTVDVTNFGTQSLTGYTVSIYENTGNALIGSVEETEDIEAGETRFYDIQWQSNAAFNTSFKAVVESIDDEFPGNNKSASMFVRVKPDLLTNVLLWDNDNGIQSVLDPEHEDMVDASTGLKRILNDADIDYEFASSLPQNLDNYDIIFATMGNYCLS
ncbi:MAG: hypothetical protein KDC09_00455 [Bacteroidales bacterium]|nr:hypothetical protein [Bacteroidales bacterium]